RASGRCSAAAATTGRRCVTACPRSTAASGRPSGSSSTTPPERRASAHGVGQELDLPECRRAREQGPLVAAGAPGPGHRVLDLLLAGERAADDEVLVLRGQEAVVVAQVGVGVALGVLAEGEVGEALEPRRPLAAGLLPGLPGRRGALREAVGPTAAGGPAG